MTFNERIKECRSKYGFTQEQLSNRLGIKRSTYAKYETGENQPEYKTLEKMADFFGVTTDYLLGRENDDIFIKEKSSQYNTYSEHKQIDEFINQLGLSSDGLFNFDKWRHLNREDIEEIISHFNWVVHKAKSK